jgi:hypothetical protein
MSVDQASNRAVPKAWNGGSPPPPRKLGRWAMTPNVDVALEAGEKLVVQVVDGKVKAYRGINPVGIFADPLLVLVLKKNSEIANGEITRCFPDRMEVELT